MNKTQIAALKQVSEILIDYAILPFREKAHTLYAIAKGLYKDSNQWESLQALGPPSLKLLTLGEFDKEKLKKVLHFNAEVTADIQGYISEWIDSRDNDQIKCLLKYITGTPVVPSKNNINFFMVQKLSGFYAHTCFYQIDLPRIYCR